MSGIAIQSRRALIKGLKAKGQRALSPAVRSGTSQSPERDVRPLSTSAPNMTPPNPKVVPPEMRRHRSTTSSESFHGLEFAKPFSEVPGSKGLSVVGHLLEVARNHNRVHEWLWEQHQELGPIFRKKMGVTEMVFITDIPAIEQLYRQEGRCPDRMNIPAWVDYRRKAGHADGVVIATGEDWLRMRRALNPSCMNRNNLARHAEGMNAVTSDFLTLLARMRQDDNLVADLEKMLFRWSLEMICSVMFDQRLGCVSEKPSDEIKVFIDSVHDILATTQRIMFFPPSLVQLFAPSVWQKMATGFDNLFDISKKFVDQKLQEIAKKGIDTENPGFIDLVISHEAMTLKETYANLAEIMGAAVDTTATAMALLLHELARHPHVQERLYQEAQCVPADRHPTTADLQEMPFLKAVIKETLRMYPTGNYVNRCLVEDAVIHGYVIPAKTQVAISMYVLGRQESLYPDPHHFRPERWLRNPEQCIARANTYAFLPFGHGKRMCIGRRLAEIEMQLFVHQLVKRFKLEATVDEPMALQSKILLSARDPVRVKMVERHPQN